MPQFVETDTPLVLFAHLSPDIALFALVAHQTTEIMHFMFL